MYRITVYILKMTFDPISYIYILITLCSRSTKSGHNTTKHIDSSSKKSIQIQPGATMLDILGPSVAEDTNRKGYYESRAEGEFEF
jgi:hypothetical protein